jgi:hypothetical protein
MTFTLVSHLREQLSELVRSRAEKERRLAAEKERLELEVGHPLASRERRLTASYVIRLRKQRPEEHPSRANPSLPGKSSSIRIWRLKE